MNMLPEYQGEAHLLKTRAFNRCLVSTDLVHAACERAEFGWTETEVAIDIPTIIFRSD